MNEDLQSSHSVNEDGFDGEPCVSCGRNGLYEYDYDYACDICRITIPKQKSELTTEQKKLRIPLKTRMKYGELQLKAILQDTSNLATNFLEFLNCSNYRASFHYPSLLYFCMTKVSKRNLSIQSRWYELYDEYIQFCNETPSVPSLIPLNYPQGAGTSNELLNLEC